MHPSSHLPPAPAQHALTLQHVSKWHGSSYRHERIHALDDLTVSFGRGRWTAIMGPSGSGKSTLLHCASGLLRVDQGRVVLAGQDITHAGDDVLTRLRRQTIGFVFQDLNLIESLTAADNVVLPLQLTGQRPSRSLAESVLARVGLAERARHKPRELSGGQQQRVAIARAVAAGPDVLFADEPTGALDAATAREVLTLIRGLVDERGQTVVMVTHDPAVATWADRVLFLKAGRLVGELDQPSVSQIAARLAVLERP